MTSKELTSICVDKMILIQCHAVSILNMIKYAIQSQ